MRPATSRVVGIGSIGGRYVRLLAGATETAPRTIPIGGSFRDPELSRLSILEPYELAERSTVDLTVIATRTGRHVADFESFAGSSRKILIEKPIAPSFDLGKGVLGNEVASSTFVSAPLRFMEGYEAVTRLMPIVGTVQAVEVACQSWLPDWRPGTNYRASYSADPNEGGVLRDLVHEIDYSLRLFGAPVSVTASLEGSEELDIAAESSARMRWEYPGFVLSMTLDYVSREPRRFLAVHGESATITWNVLEGTVVVDETGRGVPRLLRFPKDLSKDGLLLRQLEAVLSAEDDWHRCTVPDALRAVALCDAARESAGRSQPSALTGTPWEHL